MEILVGQELQDLLELLAGKDHVDPLESLVGLVLRDFRVWRARQDPQGPRDLQDLQETRLQWPQQPWEVVVSASQVFLVLQDPGDHQAPLEEGGQRDGGDLWEEEDPQDKMEHPGVRGGKDCLEEQAIPENLEKLENRDEHFLKTTFEKYVLPFSETVYLS